MIVIITAYDQREEDNSIVETIINNLDNMIVYDFDQYNVNTEELTEPLDFLLKISKETYDKM